MRKYCIRRAGRVALIGVHLLVLPVWCAPQRTAVKDSKNPSPCAEDIKRLCNSLAGTERANCLMKNESKWSQSCRDQINLETKGVMQVMETCKADADKFCPPGRFASGGINGCLVQNMAKPDFSPACRAALGGSAPSGSAKTKQPEKSKG